METLAEDVFHIGRNWNNDKQTIVFGVYNINGLKRLLWLKGYKIEPTPTGYFHNPYEMIRVETYEEIKSVIKVAKLAMKDFYYSYYSGNKHDIKKNIPVQEWTYLLKYKLDWPDLDVIHLPKETS